jgi:hypothetical protein
MTSTPGVAPWAALTGTQHVARALNPASPATVAESDTVRRRVVNVKMRRLSAPFSLLVSLTT